MLFKARQNQARTGSRSVGKVFTALVAATAFVSAVPAWAGPVPLTPNALDPTFGSSGSVVTVVGEEKDGSYASDVAVQADGKIVAVGWHYPASSDYKTKQLALVRYMSDGSVDTSFGKDGVVTTQIDQGDSADAGEAANPEASFLGGRTRVKIDSEGRIVVAAPHKVENGFRLAALRYNSDGTPDSTFSGDGQTVTGAGLVLSPSASVYVGGLGSLSDGKSVVSAIVETESGRKIIVFRYKNDGTLDPAFGNQGRVVASMPNATNFLLETDIEVQSDGKTVVAATPIVDKAPIKGPVFGLVRLENDGTLDLTFGSSGNGKQVGPSIDPACDGIDEDGDIVKDLSIDPDGNILVAGFGIFCPNNSSQTGVGISRYTSKGLIDTDFGSDGFVKQTLDPYHTPFYGNSLGYMALDPKGKIFVAGDVSSDTGLVGYTPIFAAASYQKSGKQDLGFGGVNGGVAGNVFGDQSKIAPSFIQGVTAQDDSKFLVAGVVKGGGESKASFGLVRYGEAPSSEVDIDVDPIDPGNDDNWPPNPIPNPEPGPWGP